MTEHVTKFARSYNYQKLLDNFYDHSTLHEQEKLCWEKEMPRVVKRISASGGDAIRVLAVGSGNGEPFDSSLLDVLSSSSNVQYTVVEPRSDAVEDFKKLAESEFQSVQFKWFLGTFQDYQDQEWPKHKQQFDLIHLVACIQYVGESYEELRARLVPCCTEMLREAGALVVFRLNQSEVQLFMPHAENPDAFGMPDLFEKLASEGGWKCERFETLSRVDVTPCFDETSEAGGLMLDLFTKTSNFRTTDMNAVERTLDHLRGLCQAMEDGSKVVNNLNSELSVIWKLV